MPYSKRACVACHKDFTPPHRPTFLSTGDNHLTHCAECRRLVKAQAAGEKPLELPARHDSIAPMRQVVFDLETWGLDRGWGVTLVGSFLVHGGDKGPVKKTLTLREYPNWQSGIRSDDKALVEDIFKILSECQIGYAHNGEYFDTRWLRSVALKYHLNMPRLKLVDPAAIARQKYLLGRNSLEAVADFLGLERDGLQKMHISPDVWRHALLDNDDGAWDLLSQRCESDVELLNAVAGAVTNDVGMIDYTGSWR